MQLVDQRFSEIAVLQLTGRFDAHAAPEVDQWLRAAVAQQSPRVVINLSGVNFVDSTALATLVSGMKRCRQHDGDLRLSDIQLPVRVIFELTRLDRAFEMYAHQSDAVASFGVLAHG